MKSALAALFTASVLAAATPAFAHTVVYSAPLLGANEVPAANTPATGTGTVTIDLDLLTMRVQATFSGLLGNTTAAHIHCCVNPGSNVGVATTTPTFVGFPLGVTSGSFDQTYNMAIASSYNAAYVTANGGTVGSAFNALVAGLDAGRAYLNIHTSAFPGGEIRGLLAPVPEAGTYAMMLAGLGVLGAVAAKRRQAA